MRLQRLLLSISSKTHPSPLPFGRGLGPFSISRHAHVRSGDPREEDGGRLKDRQRLGWWLMGGSLVAGGVWLLNNNCPSLEAASKVSTVSESEEVRPSLPFFKASQVAEHYDKDRRIWVSFNRGVYDITDFVAKHPGGDERILMAAGGSLEPFWQLYPVHRNSAEVQTLLHKFRIGNLAEEDAYVLEGKDGDPFAKEPRRHPALIPRSSTPFNGETPPPLLSQNFYTPNDLFYVRNHLPVPEIELGSYELEVEGLGRPKSFRLPHLKAAFPKTTISATIQCGGNRRAEMGTKKPVAGLPWTGGAIGTATFSGVRLRDLLKASGFDPAAYPHPEKVHVQFEGLDRDASGECYGASVPLSYILDNNFEPILAYEMNGEPLPLDHGFPLRVILPGIVGARSVKWLGRVRICEEESQSPWQQRDYKVFSPSVSMETVDFSAAPPIMDTPVTSYISSHRNGEVVRRKGPTVVSGYAFSGGGRSIVRVEVSTDQGQTWTPAQIRNQTKDGTRSWAWTLWEWRLGEAEKKKGAVEVWVKAVDSGYNQQTEDFGPIWNYRGLLANAYHKIRLTLI